MLKAMLKKIWRRLANSSKGPRAPDAFSVAVSKLGISDVVIDCGANVGIYTEVLARTGATVHAFEPDPACVEFLRQKFSSVGNVRIYNKAVSTRNGKARLFMHKGRDKNQRQMSESSSLLVTKTNIDPDTYAEVETVDLSEFVRNIGRVSLMKMDIEGFEIEVLGHMLDTGSLGLIESTFVELHDRKTPSLAEPTRKLRERLSGSGINVDLTWH